MPPTEQQWEHLRDRVTVLEQHHAVRTETLNNIVDRLAKIESTLSRLTWIIIGAILTALVGFVLSGGLSLVPPM